MIKYIDSDVKMRWFIIKMEDKEFSIKLLKVYGVILDKDISDLIDMYKRNMYTIMTINDVSMSGNDMMSLYGIKGKEIGRFKNLLFDMIVNGELDHSYDSIVEYMTRTIKSQ